MIVRKFLLHICIGMRVSVQTVDVLTRALVTALQGKEHAGIQPNWAQVPTLWILQYRANPSHDSRW